MNVVGLIIYRLSNTYHDAASKFIRITTRGQRNNILPEDLIPLVQDVVETHPGLTFLKEATEFHSRYVHTVRIRAINICWIFLSMQAKIEGEEKKIPRKMDRSLRNVDRLELFKMIVLASSNYHARFWSLENHFNERTLRCFFYSISHQPLKWNLSDFFLLNRLLYLHVVFVRSISRM